MIPMGYNVASTSMRSAVCRALMAKYQQEMIIQDGIEAVAMLTTENAYLDSEPTQDGLHRPCIMLVGRIKELTGEFPGDISRVRYDDPADQRFITYKYMLSRSNLAELCRKGLFEPGFDVPDIIKDNEMEIPCRVSCAVLPGTGPGDAPVIFTDLDVRSFECTDETSGYRIDEYFDPLPPRDMMPGDGLPEYEPPEYRDNINSAFGLDEPGAGQPEQEAQDEGPAPFEPLETEAGGPARSKQSGNPGKRRRKYDEPAAPSPVPVPEVPAEGPEDGPEAEQPFGEDYI